LRHDNIFELLEAVRQHKLETRECFLPINSVKDRDVGFTTADGDGPAVTWTMPTKLAKESAIERGTPEARRIKDLLGNHMGRIQLLTELRAGTLDYGIPNTQPVIVVEESEEEAFLMGIVD
jgi:hypothetical protein